MRDPDQSCSRASHKCVPASTERSSETDSPSSRNKATDRPFRSSGSGRFSLTIWGARSLESPVGVLAWKNSSKSIKNGRLKHSWLAWWQRPRLHTPSCREARGAPSHGGPGGTGSQALLCRSWVNGSQQKPSSQVLRVPLRFDF